MGGLVIAGDRSGAGKTTVTMALLSTLRSRQTPVQAFKVGPDYIDPMFHRAITGRPAYNLDPVLTSEGYVQRCFQQHSATVPYAVVEGVMGLFDGAGGTDYASTAHVARLLGCPVVLVVDCARLSRSLAAIVHGYCTLDPAVKIVGVVLNRVGSDRHLAMLQAALSSIHLPVLGILRRDDAVTLPDRHLGLVPTDELPDLPARFRHLAALGQRCFDWPQLERLFQSATSSPPMPLTDEAASESEADWCSVRIGIARDRAFNFYYEDNLAILTRLGAERVPFSPLADTKLPSDLAGIVLGGGFPEQFAAALSDNVALRTAIARKIAAGLPVYAECGGLMYLCRDLVDFDGQQWPLVGALPATTTMTGKLTLGYRRFTAQRASTVIKSGQQGWGHEFHRSAIAPRSPSPLYALSAYPLLDEPPSPAVEEGWTRSGVHASYVHLHWGDRPEIPQRFLVQCDRWRKTRKAATVRQTE